MGVKEILPPLRSVFTVRRFRVEAHDCREDLRHKEDQKPGAGPGTGLILSVALGQSAE